MNEITHQKQIDIERLILSVMMHSEDKVYLCIDQLKPDDFASEKNRALYETLIKAINELQKWEMTAIVAYAKTKKFGSLYYEAHEILEIFSICPAVDNIDFYIFQLKNFSKVRKIFEKIVKVKGDITKKENLDFSSIANDLQSFLIDISDDTGDSDISIDPYIDDVFEEIISNERDLSGISWGLKSLDRVTGGIEPGKSYVIGGLKKSGKTKFALNTTLNMIKAGVPVGWISLEMGKPYLLRWFLSHISRIPADKLKTGKNLTAAEKEKIEKAYKYLYSQKNRLFIDDRAGLDINQITAVIRKFAIKGVKVVFLDYLQRVNIKTNGNENRATSIQKIAVGLADAAKKYKVGLVYLSQLNNGAEGRIAHIGDLKESGGIGESVDCAIILNNLDRIFKKQDKQDKVRLVIEQRDGASDEIDLAINLALSEFYDIDYRKDAPVQNVGF
jgi:replicative DNA helicase